MEREEFPDISVDPVGSPRQRVDGAREQDYRDAYGDMWTCVTDGVARRWYRYDACSKSPATKARLRLVSGASDR